MVLLNQLWAFLRRDYLLASSSRLAFVWQIMSVALAAPTLYYLGRLIQPAASPHLAPFGGDYFGFVILGVGLFGFLSAGMGATAVAIRQEQMIGTMEGIMATPVSPLRLVLGASLWQTLIAAVQTVLYLLLGSLVFGIDFGQVNLLSTGVIFVLAAATFAALGILAAAFVLLFKYTDPITSALVGISALLAGVFYPTSVLPPLLQSLAHLVPLTYALRGIRLAALEGYGLVALRQEVLVLLLFTALLLPMAGMVFRWAVRYAKDSGTLSGY